MSTECRYLSFWYRQKGVSKISKESTYFLVHKKILPEAIKKTIEVKELIAESENMTINEAVKIVGISRSAYYKYKDYIEPFNKMKMEKIVTISLMLAHRHGVLSNVLKLISEIHASVLTINQGIPLQGYANVSMSVELGDMNIDYENLITKIKNIAGVRKVELISQNY